MAAFLGWIFGWESVAWQNLILFLAVLVGIFSLRSARRTERQKTTLAFLGEYGNSETAKNGAKILNRLKDGDCRNLSDEEKSIVRDFLNHLELLAIGLNNGIYDEKMIRAAMETAIVRFYKRSEGFIRDTRLRDGDVREVAYEHFEKLALKILARLKNSR